MDCMISICSAGCGWWLVLICCERKILLADWWLMAGADLVCEKNTTGCWQTCQPNRVVTCTPIARCDGFICWHRCFIYDGQHCLLWYRLNLQIVNAQCSNDGETQPDGVTGDGWWLVSMFGMQRCCFHDAMQVRMDLNIRILKTNLIF